MKSKLVVGLLTGLLLLVPFWTAQAGTTGKIAGSVANAENGEPLPGTTVRIVEIDYTVPCDRDGEFYFINVPVGVYSLEASLIGYQKVSKTNVRVLLDLTTPVDFRLVPRTLSSDSTVVVVATRDPIQADVSYSANWLDREDIARRPDAITVQSLISNLAGATEDASGNLHLRGGRDGTVTYYFDDMPVQDVFTGTAGTRISPEALEELTVVSGGYLAEYGEALSGVVNALTQEGGERYAGKLKLYDGLTQPYNVTSGRFEGLRRNNYDAGVFNLGGPFPGLSQLLGGKFFSSTEYRDLGGYLPHNRQITFSQTSRFTFKPSAAIKIDLYGNYYQARRERYEHRDVNGISYDFNLDGLGLVKSKSYRWGARATHNLSPATILTLRYNHFYTRTKQAPEKLFDKYWTEWPGYQEDSAGNYIGNIHIQNYNYSPRYWYTGFTDSSDFYPVYAFRRNSFHSFAGELLSQVDKYNQLKLGLEYRLNQLMWDNKQFFNAQPYGEKYDVQPRYAAAYFQDKVELGYMVVNAGIRADYLDAAVGYWTDPVQKTTRALSDKKVEISPRLGIAHPVTDKTVIHFNYGFYYQVPLYRYMYTNLDANLNTGYPLLGNPDMNPEKTVAYELGLNHAISSDISMKITAYYKDISNLVSTRLATYMGGSYTYYTNADYGSVKGLDLVLVKQPAGGILSGAVNYSYMIAKGNASYAYEGYYDYFTRENPPVWPDKEYPLAFDQRHKLNINVDLSIPRNYHARLFGLNVPSAWGFNAIFDFGTGMPYTKTDNEGNRVGTLNSGRLPATYRLDLRFNKDYYFSAESRNCLSFFVEVENLFDRRNIINVYTNTGLPNDDGRDLTLTTDPDGDGPATVADVNRLYRLMADDPANYDVPRTIRWGLEFLF